MVVATSFVLLREKDEEQVKVMQRDGRERETRGREAECICVREIGGQLGWYWAEEVSKGRERDSVY
jgi:hypothetical protein